MQLGMGQAHQTPSCGGERPPVQDSRLHSATLTADTRPSGIDIETRSETTTQATRTDEGASAQELLRPNLSSVKHPQTLQTPSPDIRTDQRRYGQIFHSPAVEAIAMLVFEDSTPPTNPTESMEALFPPLPPFRMRKRCGGA
jgi:hypothetical protein